MGNVLIVHSTEGTTIAGAVATMRANRSMSHEVYDPRLDEAEQLVSWDDPARSLRNLRGGVETNNRPGVWQLEVVGKAAQIPGYSIEWHRNLANRIRFICELLDIPIVAPMAFEAYPASYGRQNGVRLSNAEWMAAAGIYGHQHVPENLHGDPGDIRRTLAYLIGDQPMREPTQGGEWCLPADRELHIREQQTILAGDGFYAGAIDGDPWEATTTAVHAMKNRLAETAGRLAELEQQIDEALAEPPDRLDPEVVSKAGRYDVLAGALAEAVAGTRID